MKTILLARHATHAEVGQVLSGRSEIALSDAGRAEAADLAAMLAKAPVTAIYSSPRRRTQETAAGEPFDDIAMADEQHGRLAFR